MALQFSSSKCPPGPGLECSADLPFGLIWTPLANQGSKKIPVIYTKQKSPNELPPVLCLTCLAYLNPYCDVNVKEGVWTCALCGSENAAQARQLREGGWIHPAWKEHLMEYHQSVMTREEEDDLMEEMKEPDAQVDSCTYILVVDANLSRTDTQAVATAMERFVKERLEGAAANSTVDTQGGDINHLGTPVIKVGLVVFNHSISIYHLGRRGICAADKYKAPEKETEQAGNLRRSIMEERRYIVDVNSTEDLVTLRTCLSAVFGVATDSKEKPESRMEILKKKKHARQTKEQLQAAKQSGDQPPPAVAKSPWLAKYEHDAKNSSPKRNTGVALYCAMELLSLATGDEECPQLPSRTSRILLFTNGCPNMGDGSVVAETASAKKNDSKKSRSNGKTTKKSQKHHEEVDSGLLTKAIEYFDRTANYALGSGIGFDVFCSGSNELGLAAYQALVEPSGGYVIPHLSFATPQLQLNLDFLLQNTYIARSVNSDDDEVDQKRTWRERLKLKKAKMESSSSQVLLDIRTDSFITPTNLVGPGELLDLKQASAVDNELSAFHAGLALAKERGTKLSNVPNKEALALSMTRIKMGRADPLSTVSVVAQVNDTMEDEDEQAFFQTVARWVDPSGRKIITRVYTHKFPVAEDVNEFVQAQKDNVVSVLMGKLAVYRSMHGREETNQTRDLVKAGDADTIEKLAHETQTDIDATIQRISGEFRLLALESGVEGVKLDDGDGDKKVSPGTSSSSLDKAFPPELKETLFRMYHLRRGPLVSPGPMRSIDDRTETRGLFLRFPVEDCLQMMAPTVWSSGTLEGVRRPKVVVKSFPSETMALWDTSVMGADFHDSLCIWSGKYCQGAPFDVVRNGLKDKLLDESEGRFPQPELHMLYDGDSMSRRFTARLAPSHADSEEHQMANFPALANISEAALERLRGRFQFYDVSSDASFRKWFWSVASATNAVKEDGLHLCE